MTRMTASNRYATALLALAIVCVPGVASSQEQGFAKIGGYVGGSFVPAFTLDGETFDGFTVYQEIDGDEIALLPKLDKQKMFRGVIGHRYERAALELSYERTGLNGVFGELGTGKATFQQVNVDTRIFFLARKRVQPYILAGGGFSRLSIKDGSFLLDDPEAGVGDGNFKGDRKS